MSHASLRALLIALLLASALGASADDSRQDAHRRALRARHGLEAQPSAAPSADEPWQALLIVLSEPGHAADAAAIARIEHALSASGASLVVVLDHEGCSCVRAVHESLHRSAAQLVASSPIVAQAVRAGRLRITTALHDPKPPSPKEHEHD